MNDNVRGGAQEGVEEADQDGVSAEVREVVVLAYQGQVDELGVPAEDGGGRINMGGAIMWEGEGINMRGVGRH